MESKELHRHLLGINEPWRVERVDLDMTRGQVDVYVEHAKGVRFSCPKCGQEHAVYDHSAERTWRHLDSCQFMTYLHASPPRVSCPEHGVLQARLPWADEGSRFTHLFEALAVNVLLAANIERAAGLLRISWGQAWNLTERAVLRGRAAKRYALPKQIGVDEKAIAKGHQYMTLVCDLGQATVEYIGKGRREESLGAYFKAFGTERCVGIEAISLDMWPAFINACRDWVPEADGKMVFDRFHIMRHILEAVDKVRKQEHKALMDKGDTTLVKSKYLWLTNPSNMADQAKKRFKELQSSELKTARAWALKEVLRKLWSYTSMAWALKFWKRWYYWATHSRLQPMIDAAKLIARHLPNVLTYFKHRITNAVAEGLNSKIATVQKRACGFRNRDHFKIAIYFHCGGLDLYPVQATHGKVG
ncbi:ISL3 family transposase [Candidatus Nitrotoga sp. AM1P]|uniref:ISL3 family transposase n=1 Tax=Candidatus Nitrotoga sp. AM1P TaxID=2559597 RepID=UPI0010BBB74E|nr:ISL3 family transposase [Candidatus Nitrotoga sp. AM1P]BBJ23088.1 ISL3 family transposase [Candidatus Nitrotoga sp. AM1P]